MVSFSIGKKSYSVGRPRLFKWLQLERIRSKVLKSAEESGDAFSDNIFAYLSALLGVPEAKLSNAPWYEVLQGYCLSLFELSPKLDLSILSSGEKKDSLPEPWDYVERDWYSWVHLLAKSYGWSIEYIADLDVDDAIALVQEISLDDQFEREWEWSLSEVAYEYDPSMKKSKLRKLPRPPWMNRATKHFQASVEKPKRMLPIRSMMIPAGVIIYDKPPEAEGNHGAT